MQVFNLTNLTFILTIASLYIIIKTLFLRIVKNNLERNLEKIPKGNCNFISQFRVR